MRRYFGAVGMPDRWHPDRAEEYCISRAGIDVIICRRRRPDTWQGALHDREGCIGHIGANPISTNDGNSG